MTASFNRILMRLLFFLLFIGLEAFSQNIDLGKLENYQNSSLDTLTGKFHLYFADHKETFDLKNLKKTSTTLHYGKGVPMNASPLGIHLLSIGPATYFVQGQGGLVFKLEGDTIKRVDQSFNHQMEYGAVVFAHDNRIFKYGGYGFWSVRDFFTYFDFKRREWDVYHPENSKKIPDGINGAHHVKHGQEVTVFGGHTINPFNRRERLNNDEVWTFDLEQKDWDYKGKHLPFGRYLTYLNYENKVLIVEQNKLVLIDLPSNQRSTYEHSPLSAQINAFKKFHYFKGKFYLILHRAGKYYLNIVDKEDFFGTLLNTDPLYQNNADRIEQVLIYVLSFAAVLFLFWLIVRDFKKRNKIKLLDNGLRFRNKFTEFDSESMAILKLLLTKPYVASNQILKIVEKEQYSPAHNERVKVQKIKDINLKIGTLLGTNKNLIMNFKAENDRRIRVYTIEKSYFIN